MGALFDFKCTCDSTLVYVCQADAEKCIFVVTYDNQVTSDFSSDFLTVPQRTENAEKTRLSR